LEWTVGSKSSKLGERSSSRNRAAKKRIRCRRGAKAEIKNRRDPDREKKSGEERHRKGEKLENLASDPRALRRLPLLGSNGKKLRGEGVQKTLGNRARAQFEKKEPRNGGKQEVSKKVNDYFALAEEGDGRLREETIVH